MPKTRFVVYLEQDLAKEIKKYCNKSMIPQSRVLEKCIEKGKAKVIKE